MITGLAPRGHEIALCEVGDRKERPWSVMGGASAEGLSWWMRGRWRPSLVRNRVSALAAVSPGRPFLLSGVLRGQPALGEIEQVS